MEFWLQVTCEILADISRFALCAPETLFHVYLVSRFVCDMFSAGEEGHLPSIGGGGGGLSSYAAISKLLGRRGIVIGRLAEMLMTMSMFKFKFGRVAPSAAGRSAMRTQRAMMS